MDQHKLNVANAPKTSTFQMRINPEIKQQVENMNCPRLYGQHKKDPW